MRKGGIINILLVVLFILLLPVFVLADLVKRKR